MIASRTNGLCRVPETIGRSLFGKPSSRSYRTAVAQAIRDIKARNQLSNEALADVIGCSEQTVANAENEVGDLTAVILLNLAYAFGEDSIESVRSLYLCAPAREPSVIGELDAAERHFNAARKLILEREL
jgi:transcriptional regulator with XRE-family HTH domain